jgi:hypothetical protein
VYKLKGVSTAFREWQWPLSGVHSIMIVKSAQPVVRVGGAPLPPFTLSTITSKVVVYAPAERADALPLFLLYPYMYSVGKSVSGLSFLQRKLDPHSHIQTNIPSRHPTIHQSPTSSRFQQLIQTNSHTPPDKDNLGFRSKTTSFCFCF